MLHLFDSSLAAASDIALPILVESAAKGLLFLVLVCAATMALRRASASLRYLVWLSAFACLFLLPLMSLVLPDCRVLPVWLDAAAWAQARSPVRSCDSKAWAATPYSGRPANAPPRYRSEPATPIRGGGGSQKQDVGASATTHGMPRSPASARPGPAWQLPQVIFGCWGIGVVVLGLRLLVSKSILSHLAGTARRASRGHLHTELQSLRRRVGIRRPVRLLVSHRREVPMTWGVWRANVLLPSQAEAWSEPRLHAVLLHELAHVKRGDTAAQLFVQLVCLWYWFNPLMWWAARRMRVEREQACDDFVLNNGVKASEYAEQLIDIAIGCTDRSFGRAWAVAMARPCRLEGRLMTVLDKKIHRKSPTRTAIAFCSVAVGALILPVALLRGAAPEPISERPADTDAPAPASEELDQEEHGGAAAEPTQHRGVIRGVLTDAATGEPVAGAYVGVGDFGDAGGVNFARFRNQGLFAKAETDQQGQFVLGDVAVGVEHPLIATHPDFVRHVSAVMIAQEEAAVEVEVEMEPAAELTVKLKGTSASEHEIYYTRIESLEGYRIIPPDQNPHLSSFASSSWIATAQQGEFRFHSLRPGPYRVDAFGTNLNREGERPVAEEVSYFGGVERLELRPAGQRDVVVDHADHGTRVSLRMLVPDNLAEGLPEGSGERMRSLLVLHRDPGVLAWVDDMWHHPEDARLGRLSLPALLAVPLATSRHVVVRNLPPGDYAVVVLVGPPVAFEGRRLSVDKGQEVDVEISLTRPQEAARATLGPFERSVELQPGMYTAAELATRINQGMDGLMLQADPAIASRTVELTGGTITVWEILEEANRQAGWRIEEIHRRELKLVPQD